MGKLCAFCKHFDWEGVNYHYYSPETGGNTEAERLRQKLAFAETMLGVWKSALTARRLLGRTPF
jgi:hypothetical protein